MKKPIALVLATLMIVSMAACGSPKTETPAPEASAPAEAEAPEAEAEAPEAEAPAEGAAADKVYKIALLVPFIGDQSYFDTVNMGRLAVEEYPNVETTLIEMTEDKAKWEGYYLDACEGGYDLIIGGNNDAEEFLYGAAERYPDQKFFNFDYVNHVDLPNVYANMYNTPELGYLTGALASMITTSGMEKANPDKKIGVIVGMDIPAMNDFVGGFCQVADEMGVQVVIGYPESFTDAAKAKEIALNMYNQGVDVIWQVAGGAGAGVFEAAAQAGRYAIGVDSDQTISFAGQPELAKTIVTSMYKDCGKAVQRAVDMFIAGEYPSGVETLGLAQGGVGLIENEQYKTMVPQDIRDQVQSVIDKVASGQVQVLSALQDPDGWATMKEKATAPH